MSGVSLGRSVSWSLLGVVGYTASQAGVLVLLAKLGSPEMVGQFALGLAVSAPLFLFGNLQLDTIQATDARSRFAFSDYFALRLTTVLLTLAVVGLVVLGSGYPAGTARVVALVALSKAVEAVGNIFSGAFQKHERTDCIAFSMLARGAASLVTMAAGLLLTGGLAWGLVAMTVVWAALLLGYDFRRAAEVLGSEPGEGRLARVRPRWRPGALRTLVAVAWPLGLVSMLDSLNANLPRYFIQHHQGEAAVGYYAALAYLMIAGSTMADALIMAARPRLARLYGTDMRAFRGLLLRMLVVSLATGAAGLLVVGVGGARLLTLLYRPDYAQHLTVLVWLMVAAALWYVVGVLAAAIAAAQYFRIQAVLLAATVAGTGLGSLWLVPRYGIVGGAWGLCIGMAVRLAFALVLTLYVMAVADRAAAPAGPPAGGAPRRGRVPAPLPHPGGGR